ncbi:transporter substrate-binding domain-containing protein [Romeria aff. gracilis LEGE 07310]|uniref:Transporter substrate-binding domain-containing protein n=1 Tax=Vasconcelosia minhoensis LEGE 07310 TaxID=915328 RepID=A0A8J7DMQ7_9CYAN|nr:transporter substrate-binding domain-containing protein [Romeria gracilis]MBE9079191.1 transporter substrate-binding domain-containing protein [Romeria aff. gracilis LEGE 07310]
MSLYFNRRKFLWYGTAGLSASMLLKACTSPSADSTSTETSAADSSDEAASAGMSVEDVKAMGKLRVGLEAAYPPFAMRDGSEIIGYDIDLGQAMAETLGVEFEPVDTPWAGVIPSLYGEKFDLIFGSMSYTPERVEKVAFSIPYTEASQAALIRVEDEGSIQSVDDLSGKVLGIKLGSPGEVLSKELEEKLKAEKGEGFAEIKIYDDHPAAYLALGQGKVDAVLNTISTLGIVLRDQPEEFTVVRGFGQDNWAGIAAREADTALVSFVDEELKRLKANGTLDELQEKWFGFTMNLPNQKPVVEDGELAFVDA